MKEKLEARSWKLEVKIKKGLGVGCQKSGVENKIQNPKL